MVRTMKSLYKKEKIKMTQEEKARIENNIVEVLKTVYDPEIPVNILKILWPFH